MIDSMRRYVTYDGNNDIAASVTTLPERPAQNGAQGQADGGSAASSFPKAQTWAAGADPHLSGGDPRMFPGVLTRGHRTNSLRNLGGQPEEAAKGSEQ